MLVKKFFLFTLALFIRIRREEEGGGRGGKEGRKDLACAVHQVKQILCKCSIVFLGGEFFGLSVFMGCNATGSEAQN